MAAEGTLIRKGGARVEEILEGGWQTRVRRIGDRVHRSSSPWSPAVISLLRHLAEAGFEASPRPIGSGFDDEGDEVLAFVPGESPQPHPWSDEAAGRIGALLRELHRAAASFEPPTDPRWKIWYGRSLGEGPDVVGHGDLGPWNIMASDGLPVGFIDWDYAGPINRVSELAQVAWLNAQLHDDDVAERVGLSDAVGRAKQVGLIVDGYGLGRADRVGFVDRMVEHAVHSARDEAAQNGVTPDTTSALGAGGFPVLWSITWRTRSASWMLRNRRTLEAAL